MSDSLKSRVDQFEADVDLTHQLVHGDDAASVDTDSGPVRSFAHLQKDLEGDLNAAAAITETGQNREAAETARQGAETAEQGAEQARDAAQLSAGIYADTASGLAATVEGDYFSVPSASSDEYLILYRHDAGPMAIEVKRYPSAQSVKAALTLDHEGTSRQRYLDSLTQPGNRPKAAVMILLGQSLNAGRGAIDQAKANGKTFMFTGGAHVSAWNLWSINKLHSAHWNEMASTVAYEEGGDGQSPGAGIGSTLVGGLFDRAYICSVAVGARTLSVLSASGPRCNIYATVERGCTLARADGYDPYVMFYSAHGEADASAGTTQVDYYAQGVYLYQTAQLAAAQFMRRRDYIAPVVLTYPVQQNTDDADREIKEAIRRIADALTNGINLGPIYQWPCEADRVHPTPASYVKRGEAVGRALRAFFERSDKSPAPHIVDVTWDGATEFVATFNTPVVRDASLGVGENLNSAEAEDGFEWLDNGTGIAITALSYEGYKVRGTLASIPVGTTAQQTLRIAVQTTTGTLMSGADNLPGSVVRADTNSWPSLNDHTYANYLWASPQTFSNVRDA